MFLGGAVIKKSDELSVLEIDKIRLIHLFVLVGVPVLYIMAFLHYSNGDYSMAFFEVFLATGGVVIGILLKIFNNIKLSENLILSGLVLLVIGIIINGGYEKTGIYWIYVFPIVSFFLKGNKGGVIWNIFLMFVILFLMYLDMHNVVAIAYSYVEIRQALISYVVVFLLAYIFESALLKSYQRLKHVAITDQLTGLYNRHYIFSKLEEEIKRARRFKKGLCVMLLDIDNFKQINDVYGHDVGDRVLQVVAQVLRKNVRQVDTVGRLGGEEFIIICPDTNEKGGMILGEKLRLLIKKLNEENIPPITVSVGVASFSMFDTSHELIKKADIALYRAKKSGKNKVVIYNDAVNFLHLKNNLHTIKKSAAAGRH